MARKPSTIKSGKENLGHTRKKFINKIVDIKAKEKKKAILMKWSAQKNLARDTYVLENRGKKVIDEEKLANKNLI